MEPVSIERTARERSEEKNLALPVLSRASLPIIKGFAVGVLDIQGSVEEHLAMLRLLGVDAREVKTVRDLDEVAGLIIPGGESTTIGKLMKEYGLDEAIRLRAVGTGKHAVKPLTVWGTCAGAILLAKKVAGRRPDTLAIMDISVRRNAYGRQVDSFETELAIPALGTRPVPAIFIRAPVIEKASPKAKILAEYQGSPVMVQEKNLLATTFHPELTEDTRVHEYFLSLTKHYAQG